MPTEAQMKDVLQRYIAAWNAADADAIIELFADEAVVEDPYGSTPYEGKAAFGEFFRGGTKAGVTLSLDTPVRASEGDSAAMAFTVTLPGMTIRVIDVMDFDDSGRIIHMCAYWGPGDITPS